MSDENSRISSKFVKIKSKYREPYGCTRATFATMRGGSELHTLWMLEGELDAPGAQGEGCGMPPLVSRVQRYHVPRGTQAQAALHGGYQVT